MKTAALLLVCATLAAAADGTSVAGIPADGDSANSSAARTVPSSKSFRPYGKTLLIGGGPIFGFEMGFDDDTVRIFSEPALGISAGYRSRFGRKLGWQADAGLGFGVSTAQIWYNADDPVNERTERGISDFVTVVMGTAGLVIGPLWHLTIDPGIGFSYIKHTGDSVTVGKGSAALRIRTPDPVLRIDFQLAASLALGRKQAWMLTLWEHAGINPAEPFPIVLLPGIRFSRAFEFGGG